jgi:hypothetical protein
MHLGEQRGPVAFEAVDDRELPEGTVGVPLLGVEGGGHVEQHAVAAGGWRVDAPHVEVDVELGVGLPAGDAEEAGRRDSLPQPGYGRHGPVHAVAEAGEVRGAVEEGDVEERRAEGGIALDRPHERFRLRHAPTGLDGSVCLGHVRHRTQRIR